MHVTSTQIAKKWVGDFKTVRKLRILMCSILQRLTLDQQ